MSNSERYSTGQQGSTHITVQAGASLYFNNHFYGKDMESQQPGDAASLPVTQQAPQTQPITRVRQAERQTQQAGQQEHASALANVQRRQHKDTHKVAQVEVTDNRPFFHYPGAQPTTDTYGHVLSRDLEALSMAQLGEALAEMGVEGEGVALAAKTRNGGDTPLHLDFQGAREDTALIVPAPPQAPAKAKGKQGRRVRVKPEPIDMDAAFDPPPSALNDAHQASRRATRAQVKQEKDRA